MGLGRKFVLLFAENPISSLILWSPLLPSKKMPQTNFSRQKQFKETSHNNVPHNFQQLPKIHLRQTNCRHLFRRLRVERSSSILRRRLLKQEPSNGSRLTMKTLILLWSLKKSYATLCSFALCWPQMLSQLRRTCWKDLHWRCSNIMHRSTTTPLTSTHEILGISNTW